MVIVRLLSVPILRQEFPLHIAIYLPSSFSLILISSLLSPKNWHFCGNPEKDKATLAVMSCEAKSHFLENITVISSVLTSFSLKLKHNSLWVIFASCGFLFLKLFNEF